MKQITTEAVQAKRLPIPHDDDHPASRPSASSGPTEGVSERQLSLVSWVLTVWILAGVITVLWWQDLGAERFYEFIGRTVIVGIVAFGITMATVVGVLASRTD